MSALAKLESTAAAAQELGLEAEAAQARELLLRAEERIGFEGSAFVLALAGGTGVGKSSLLNAIASRTVSVVSVLRPTTSQPLAWVAADQLGEVEPLLEWLGIKDVTTHDEESLSGIVILDLPDFDSVELEHRATVERLLPRIDAMLWVVDNEKYDDEMLHAYLRDVAIHADRINFVLNKSDRLDPAGQALVRDDLARRLETAGYARPSIFVVSAQGGEGLDSLLIHLRERAIDKELIQKKLEADARSRLAALAAAAGVASKFTPLLSQSARTEAADEAVRGALTIVDPDRVAAQVKAAVLYRARRQGGSLLARILALLSNLTGTRKRSADPMGFLLAWRQRGSMGHVLNPIRRVIVDAVSRLPGRARPQVMKTIEFDRLEERLTHTIERSVRTVREDLDPPSSWLWILIGGLQLVLGGTFLFAVAWYLTVIFGPGSLLVGTVDLPYLGPVPVPLALLVGSLVVSLLLGLVLNLHASWIGRRRGARVSAAVRTAIEETLERDAFARLDQIEAARQRIAEAATS